MATGLNSKTFRVSRRPARQAAAKPADKKIGASAPCCLSDREWNAGMARMRELMGSAFAGVDIEEYVNSFRR